ncbi:DUF397 domain-containing protein [Nocardia carnea]|uniref:DUF397 domain-containing protein n=1 Tax=Nocardia carnea TaxID=37328 RepID=UPI002457453E|nr:DUF397 domain-containing protein [Nocardia carnea]
MTSDMAPARWFKSSHSDSTGECVEVAWLNDTTIGVRDSKNPAGPVLVFAPSEWATFTTSLRLRPR